MSENATDKNLSDQTQNAEAQTPNADFCAPEAQAEVAAAQESALTQENISAQESVPAQKEPLARAEENTAEAQAEVAAETIAPAEVCKPKRELTRGEEKKLAYKYLIFAAITFAGIYVVQIFHLFDPLFSRIYYGNLTTIFFYILNVFFWIPFIVVLYKQIRKRTGFCVFFRESTPLSLKRSLIIYACAVVPIFIVSAALGFQLKIVFELGKRVTGMQLITNASMYAHGAVKLILAIILIELVQEAAELLYKGKYAKQIPWGGIALAVLYGFTEVIVAYASGAFTMFAWLYIAFDLLYGVIYLLGKKRFSLTFFVSLIIYIL